MKAWCVDGLYDVGKKDAGWQPTLGCIVFWHLPQLVAVICGNASKVATGFELSVAQTNEII
jgi:hypothetical protein